MKKSLTIALALLLSLTAAAQTETKPFAVPELKTWTAAEGTLTLSGRVIAKNKNAATAAKALEADSRLLLSQPLTVAKGKTQTGDITLDIVKDKALGDEGYRLEIGDAVKLSAATSKGLFWGTRTLLQMLEQQASLTLPKGSTTDVPEYELRGFMLDCGRKYIPIDYIRNLVKVMSYYKMNTLQLHLNDNGFKQYFGNDWARTPAAFRLESDYFPGLAAKDGYYTKKEFIELQKLAEQYGVEIIPEIDVPAHSLAFTHYRPSIGSKEYGMDHLDISKKETYAFVDSLFDEYLGGKEPVFRGHRFNIGTDEYSNANKEVVEQFRAFTDHYLRLAQSYGKQAMCWGALTHANGTTPVTADNVIMNCWYNGYADPKEMKKQGYKLVSIPDGLVYIVPAAGYYYDYLNCQYLYEHWTPAVIGNAKFEENDPDIVGGMFAVWNDHAGNGISVSDIHHRVFPALQTLSVKCWTGKHTSLDYAAFDSQRKHLSEAPGVNELGTLGHGNCQSDSLSISTVAAGQSLNAGVSQVGYDYSVSFDVDCQKEEKGTVLLSSDRAVFYLADPQQGRLAFERDGYLNAFNYALPASGKVNIRIEGNNEQTALYVNGQHKQTLSKKTLYVMPDKTFNRQTTPWPTTVYDPTQKMYYVSTLVFPLQQAGNFNSKVTNLLIHKK